MSYQLLLIVGNLGKDPEMKYTPSGQAVTQFSVATNREWDQNGQTMKETTWFRCTAWGKSAESISKYFKQGQEILVEGRMKPDPKTGRPATWLSTKDGSPQAGFDVTVTGWRFTGTKSGNGSTSAPADDSLDNPDLDPFAAPDDDVNTQPVSIPGHTAPAPAAPAARGFTTTQAPAAAPAAPRPVAPKAPKSFN